MNMYIILLLGLLVISFISFFLSKFELLAPMTLVPVAFCAATVMAMIGLGTWNSIELKSNCILVILAGCAAFSAGGFIANRFFVNSTDYKPVLVVENKKETYVKYVLLIIFLIVAIFLRVFETYKLGNEYNIQYSTYSDLSAQVRQHTTIIYSTSNIRIDEGFSFIEKQFEKIVLAAGYITAFLVIYNIKRTKKQLINIVLSVAAFMLCCSFTLASGERTRIMYYIMAMLIAWFILTIRSGQYTSMQTSVRMLVFLVPLFILLIGVFYFSGSLIGRAPGSGIVEYISFYLGGGIPSLQYIMDQGFPQGPFGIYTFYGIYSLLFKVGVINHLPIYSFDWINLGGHNSNIFTAFGRYYVDFGFGGVILLCIISGIIFTLLFKASLCSKHPYCLILFMWIGSYCFDLAREDYLFSRFIASNNLITLAVILAGSLIMTSSISDCLSSLVKKSEK